MAQATKRAPKTAPTKPPATSSDSNTPPGFRTLKKVALPELWPKIGQPEHVKILEPMRADGPVSMSVRKRPAALVRVRDLNSEAEKDLAITLPLKELLALHYPGQRYVGRCFRITRCRRHERQNAYGFTVEEITNR